MRLIALLVSTGGRPDARQSIRRAPPWRSALALLLLAAGTVPAAGQDEARLLESVREAYRQLSRRFDLVGVRRADRSLARLGALRYADPGIRARAARFLSRVAEQRGPLAIFRVRVAAVNLLVEISESRKTVAFLLGLARRSAERDLRGIDFFIEEALTRLRGRDQVRYLVEHVDDSRDAVVKLSIGALARLADDDLVLLALPATPRIADLALAGTPGVRARALSLLGRLPDERALPPLAQAARAREGLLRLAAARALGHKTDRKGVDLVLGSLLTDPLPRVREAAIRSYGGYKEFARAAELAARLDKEPLRLRHAIARSLKRITGEDLGPDGRRWRAWLASRRGTSRPLRPRNGRKPRYAPRYYGIPITSDRIVFILDISGSMQWGEGEGRKRRSRLDIAKRELVQVLKQLTPSTRFNIVLFSWSAIVWKRKGLVPASHAQVEEAVRWVERQRSDGGTNTHEALRLAFEQFQSADTIYLLSDGSPTVGSVVGQEQILYQVHRWNRLRGVQIHGIALLVGEAPTPAFAQQDDKEDARRFMRLLAEQTGGRYVQKP